MLIAQPIFLPYFLCIVHTKNLRIDTIMNHPEIISAEKRLLHLRPYPVGYRHNHQFVLRHGSKSLLLIKIVLPATVYPQACREFLTLRTLSAPILPTVTVHIRIIITMSRIKPAVMYSPHYRNIAF